MVWSLTTGGQPLHTLENSNVETCGNTLFNKESHFLLSLGFALLVLELTDKESQTPNAV